MDTIDTTFDFRTDTTAGRDIDSGSPTLRRYHQRIWSRPLPDGTPFELSIDRPGWSLFHASGHGSLSLASDAIVLACYDDFFGLFGSFQGYVEFFLLQDFVDETMQEISFWLPFDDFCRSPLPTSVDEYLGYREHAMSFIARRNARIGALPTRSAHVDPTSDITD